ncbi:MAG: hypothetical protein JWQ35_2100 [Bacteriovoracaceae bacterium]|nr:hypothetical protein [Bacteriovoracaceae bacterium]
MRLRSFFYFVCILLLAKGLYSQTSQRIFGFRGIVPGVQGQSINSMSIRSDGRYLFYSNKTAGFQALDLQDMATVGNAIAVNGIAFGVFLTSDTRAAVATANGVEYFNVTYPFAVTEESQKYTRDISSNTTVMDACMDSSQNIYFLEQGTASNHIVRVVNGLSQTALTNWSTIFSAAGSNFGNLNPVAIRCGAQGAFVLASQITNGSETGFWVAGVGALSMNAFDIVLANSLSNYQRTDFVLSQKKDQLIFLYNKIPANQTGITIDNSKAVFVSPSGSFSLNVGSSGKAVASFLDATQVFHGFFIGQDVITNPSNPPSNNFLFSQAENFTTAFQPSQFGTPGVGDASAGASTPSLWVSSANDHYKYGATESSGLVLISKAPLLQFVGNPQGQTLLGSQPLKFTLTSDSDVNYEFHIDSNADARGSSSGISTSAGTTIKAGTLSANTNTDFVLTASDVGLTLVKNYSLMIFARAPNDGPTGLTARTGFTFLFNPPPGPVTHFKLGFGDESAEASFGLPPSGNIATIILHFSYNLSDLDSLPSDTSSLAASARTVTILNGATLTSPIQIPIANWNGSYVIAPIENGKTIYVRPQLLDNSGQFSSNDPAALGVTVYRTLSIAEALGSANSCELQVNAKWDSSVLWLTFFGLLALFGIRRGSKNWAQHI